ncbi:hypothetical protein E1J38_011665 [Seonamhaeicola sediminis]|uniref:Uncharacterized protein n=1 Tax=Seonamhaeicola sediminis TaxID=2528206 RepID=A0A562YC54_9FLAO|nr:DUF6095 family protein [Seonamhaeicola sediminis]TWO32026.1 hypothetical protein E1J38_011665 [Seonamhaeicola sediminis]
MTETKKTNKEILLKGLKLMGASLACMFIGPTLIYISQTKLSKPIDTIMLIIAILICGLAVFTAFKGINIILDSIFKNKDF